MKTYQDLVDNSTSESSKTSFVLEAINEYYSTPLYYIAKNAEEYYRGLNPTIMKLEKYLTDAFGQLRINKWTPNHKIASNFFNFAITQENQYLLGNGAEFSDDGTKEKLGKDFDTKLQKAGKDALVGGVSFGFWNLDHLEVFSVTEFVPLYDEENGALKAGIRFWQVRKDKPLRATLYELDGYTDYIKSENKNMTVLEPKKAYRQIVVSSTADGTAIYDGENYPSFPIVPLWGNDKKQSEIVGRRGTLDAYDLINSNLVNNVSEGNVVYWMLKNAGGMSQEDDNEFIQRLITTRIAHTSDDVDVTSETVEAPYNASQVTSDMLKQQLYDDFMCLKVSDLSSSSKTATEIRAAYQPLDSKCDMYEYQIIEFIQGILNLAGIDDTVSFKRSKIINQSEEIQTLLSLQGIFDNETIIEQACYILGMPDKADDLIARSQREELDRYNEAEKEVEKLKAEKTDEEAKVIEG